MIRLLPQLRRSSEGDVPVRGRFHVPRWKRLLLLTALLMMGVPLAASVIGEGGLREPGAGALPVGARAMLEGAPPGRVADRQAPWGSAAFRLGLSFLAGFVVAYVMRAVLGMTVRAAIAVLVVILVLQYVGVTLVSADMLGEYYDRVSAWLGLHMDGVKQAMQTHLPSSGAAVAGWLVGLGSGRR
jgi:uncharacterized membrane protein (Fun14 family)